MTRMFRVGQKVVCVEGHDNPPMYGALTTGTIYTVRDFGLAVTGVPGIRLIGIEFSSGPFEYGLITGKPFRDAFYRIDRFRPLVTRETDISALEALLNPSLEDLRAIVRENANV